MEFPQSFPDFLEGDFKDTRIWGQRSCCLTFAMRYSSKNVLIAKKDSFLQYILWRANPISSKHASTGELWVVLTPWWCVGWKEEVGSKSGANRPCFSAQRSQLVFLDAETGGSTIILTDPLSYVDCSQDHAEQDPGVTEESTECVGEEMRKLVSDIIQHRMLAALQRLAEDLKAPMCNCCLVSKLVGCCQHQSHIIRHFLQKHSALWDNQPTVFIFQPTWCIKPIDLWLCQRK